jgi:SAM-dependent methyltransferase
VPVASVFTPSHRPDFLGEAYASLKAQTLEDWEWVVLLNNGAQWTPPDDPRVRVERADDLKGVGALKRRACMLLTSDIFVELDHDDVLASTALEKVIAAFEAHPEVGFVYSDTAQITESGAYDDSRFDERNGWVYSDVKVDGKLVQKFDAMEPTPHNVSYIWFAPNHVRAFRRQTYDAAGGYDNARDILDDQDLMGRLYQQAAFLRIPECLYLQRMHGQNTQLDDELNPRIQNETVVLYDRDIQANLLAWSAREGLKALDMGAAHRPEPGFLGVDQYATSNVDIVADVTKGIPLPDSSVGVIRAVDFIEHIPDKIALFNELYRVLAHGGMLLSLTPSTDGRGAFQDPTHVAFYNENSFWYFTDRQYANFVPQIECRFQQSRLVTYFPTDWHRQNDISYVCANLIAFKDGPRQGGILNF